MRWVIRLIALVVVGLGLVWGAHTAVASDGSGFSPACNSHELGEKSVILVMTDNGLQALQTVSDCESVLAQPADPTSLQLVSVQTAPSRDSVTIWGLAFVAILFATLLALWVALIRPARHHPPR